jgi:transposase
MRTEVFVGLDERRRAAGKPKKVALIACARKPLTILNAMIRDNAGWVSTEHRLRHTC